MRTVKHADPPGRKKIWIDLDNSPHVPFFAPIIEELEGRWYSVIVTARDAFQVRELADLFHLTYRLIGHHHGKHLVLKAYGTCVRALQLIPIMAKDKPDLAVSHGSRSMCLAAAFLGIPYVRICDYEFAHALPFVKPKWVIFPEVIPDSAIPMEKSRILRYPGIKEDVYVSRFRPDDSIKSQLGINGEDVIVTVRPPANEAHYRNAESDVLFKATIEFLCQSGRTRVILLPRNAKQATSIRECWPDLFTHAKILIPEQAVDGLNLIWFSDLVISGGGTMNREAAALGVPAYSIFRGPIGAVDRYLSDCGRLVLLESVEDVRTKIVLERRTGRTMPASARNAALSKIVNEIVSLAESNCPSPVAIAPNIR